MTRTAPRIAELDIGKLSPRQREVYDAIASGPRGMVVGPLRVWLHSPELAQHAQGYGAGCRFGSTLPRRLSELAVLVMAAQWRAGFEWAVHEPTALEAGLSRAAVEAIRRREEPPLEAADERALWEFCRELLYDRRVTDATYARLVAEIGQQMVVELVLILGYYALISMTVVAFDVPLPDGAPEPFARL
jgi:4-carboxymuconolactone decarboxylase